MSKHEELRQDELQLHKPPKRTTQCLERIQTESGGHPERLNVLDWGCGRGLDVLWLRERGFNAFGIDVDELPVNNGLGLVTAMGHPASCLRVFRADGSSDFPDDFFDAVVSNQVFEHVEDLASVAREMWRITRPGGVGYHVFPAHKYVVEGHLFMPCVHWLPKNALRRSAIHFFTTIGVEPRWPELNGLKAAQKAKIYYRYSVEHTFYRRPDAVIATFGSQGFISRFETIKHPRVLNHWLLGRLARRRWSAGLVDFLLLNFVSNELVLQKPVESQQ